MNMNFGVSVACDLVCPLFVWKNKLNKWSTNINNNINYWLLIYIE